MKKQLTLFLLLLVFIANERNFSIGKIRDTTSNHSQYTANQINQTDDSDVAIGNNLDKNSRNLIEMSNLSHLSINQLNRLSVADFSSNSSKILKNFKVLTDEEIKPTIDSLNIAVISFKPDILNIIDIKPKDKNKATEDNVERLVTMHCKRKNLTQHVT